ncbi:hypothetical protein JNW90_24270 [Micromonospora sp. STR1s_5]|nr:hypothetical protein [Micromonospora sp. STR1s_5]
MSTAVEERQAADTRPHPDTGAPETVEQREERLLADRTEVTMREVAEMIGRGYAYVRDLNSMRRRWTTIVKDGIVPARKGQNETDRPATALEIATAKVYLVDALPAPVKRLAQTDVWEVRQIAEWGAQAQMLDEWYEPKPKSPPGKAREVVIEEDGS